MFRSNIRMGEKCDLCVFYNGKVVGARWFELSVSETADLLEISHTTVLEFTQRNHILIVEDLEAETSFLVREVRGE